MATLSTRNEFAPPHTPGLLRALALALLAHGLLLVMLTVGVQWKRDATAVTVEAELWSAVPTEAAPPAHQPDTPIEPPPPIPPVPVAPAVPVAAAPPATSPAPTHDADIALSKEKIRLQKEKQVQQEKQLQQDKLNKEKLAREKQAQAKAEHDKKLQQAQRAQEAKAAADAAKAAQAAKQQTALKARQEAQKLEELRQQNMKRMTGLAGASAGNGDERTRGTAALSSGPSAGYGGRIVARIKPNITYTESITGNPSAEVEVRTAPDGTIISRKLTRSSGVKSWDDAVLKAIDKTEVLPRDVDGRVPTALILSFRPQD